MDMYYLKNKSVERKFLKSNIMNELGQGQERMAE